MLSIRDMAPDKVDFWAITFTAHSSARLQPRFMRPASVLALLLALAASPAALAQQAQRTCFSAAETRAKIAADKLAEPFPLMRGLAAEHRADAIGVKLCETSGGLVWEIELLRKDGRLIQAILDAATGKPLGGGRR